MRWGPLIAALAVVAAPASADAPGDVRALAPLPDASRARGALDGLTVYLSAGHGYVQHPRGEGWQRPVTHGLREDRWTAHFATRDLIPALERAGATVLTARERDPHRERIVVGPDHPDFAAPGGLRAEHGVRLPPGAHASWELAAPHAGTWQLYARWPEDPELGTGAYTVHHPGGRTRIPVDQSAHARAWYPLARLDLDAGDPIAVELAGPGLLAADAVRLGGGLQTLRDPLTAEPTVRRAWELAALHHLPELGAPPSVWDPSTWDRPGGGLGGDATARARWAAWAHPDGEEAVYLSVHTDAGGGTGTTAFVRRRCTEAPCPDRDRASTALADALRTALVDEVRAGHAPEWRDRGTRAARLAEVSAELDPGLPAVLLELGFHDHVDDARHLATPAFRATAADSLVRGLIRWRHGPDGPELPPPVSDVRWTDEQLTWAPGSPGSTSEPSEWRVRTRAGGFRWTTVTRVSDPVWTGIHGVDLVEITPVSPAGLGRPIRVEPPGFAIAEGAD